MKTYQISRRKFLRGVGVTLTLPLLDAMLPRVFAAEAKAGPPRRMLCIDATLGLHAENLFPKQTGRDYEMTPYLKVIEEFRNDFTIFSGLSHPEVDGSHSSVSSFLTAAPHPAAASFKNTISLDQLALEKLIPDTRFTSLQLTSGKGGKGLSYSRSGVMIPADDSPAKLFRRLFINGTPDEVQTQMQRLKQGESVLDTVLGEARKLQSEIGPRDREKLDQYFTSVREVEKRLHKSEEWAQRPKPVVDAKPPVDIPNPADVVGRTRAMFSLIRLALQTDSTRLITMNLEGHNLVPPIEGVSVDWHNLSHHGQDPDKLAQLRIIELEQMKLLASLLGELRQSREEGGTLLDHTTVLFASNLGNASSHDTKNMPVIVAGGGFKHGQHLAFDPQKNPPLCNLYVQLLQRLGVEADQFASSKAAGIPGFSA